MLILLISNLYSKFFSKKAPFYINFWMKREPHKWFDGFEWVVEDGPIVDKNVMMPVSTSHYSLFLYICSFIYSSIHTQSGPCPFTIWCTSQGTHSKSFRVSALDSCAISPHTVCCYGCGIWMEWTQTLWENICKRALTFSSVLEALKRPLSPLARNTAYLSLREKDLLSMPSNMAIRSDQSSLLMKTRCLKPPTSC